MGPSPDETLRAARLAPRSQPNTSLGDGPGTPTQADAQTWAYTIDEANYVGACITCLTESHWHLRPTFMAQDKGHPHVNDRQ